MVRRLLERFTKDKFRAEKVIQRKGDKLYFKWKGSNNSFSSWIEKKGIVIYKSYFSEPYTRSKKNFEFDFDFEKVEFDLSNYVTKSCLKNTTNVDTFDQHLLKRLI